MSQFWSDIVHQLTPYVPGEQPKRTNLVKLNTNENPYPPSPAVLAAITAAIDERLRLYPDPNGQALKAAIADYHAISAEHVFVGNGSDEVLAHAFCGLLKHDKPLLFPDITYSFYPVYCGLYGVDYQTIPLRDDFTLEPADFSQPNGAIIFPNPNAPTGRLLPLDQVEALLQQHPTSVIVVDEAYIDFGGDSAIPLVQQYDNLLVVQTLSKSRSLAGLRIGFAVGQPALIEALERVKNSFNSYPVDRLALAAGVAAYEDRAYFEQTCQQIIASRHWLTQALQQLGFDVVPSHANFVLAKPPRESDAERVFLALREQGVLVRYFKTPRISDYLRITIGTREECEQLTLALKQSMASD